MKQIKIKKLVFSVLAASFLIFTVSTFAAAHAFAATPKKDGSSGTTTDDTSKPCLPGNSLCTPEGGNSGGGTTGTGTTGTGTSGSGTSGSGSTGSTDTTTAKTGEDGTVGNACADKDVKKCLENDKFVGILKTIVKFLSAGVGIVVIFGIIVGGIRYIVAGDDSGAVMAAKKQIYNAVFAFLVFAFAFAILQWLIPGGIL